MNDAGESLEARVPWSEEKRKKAREYMARYNAGIHRAAEGRPVE